MPGGGTCSLSPGRRPPPGQPFSTGLSFTLQEGVYKVLLQGQVAPDLGIARVTLRSATGETAIPFANGYYLGQLPETGSSGTLPPGGPYALVGYDRAGHVVATQDLGEVVARSAPKAR